MGGYSGRLLSWATDFGSGYALFYTLGGYSLGQPTEASRIALWEATLWEATGRLLGGYWEATGKLLGGYWEATVKSREWRTRKCLMLIAPCNKF